MKDFKEFISNPVVIALLTAFVMWVAGWVRTFLAKRVHYLGPEAEAIKQQGATIKRQGDTIEKIVVTVNCLREMKGPELDLLIALGEAAQGQNDGNVSTALKGAYESRDQFKGFLGKSACIEVPNA